MKVASVTVQQYTLPLTRPLTTDTLQMTRQGLVLTLQSDTGDNGYGEISPLPGLHRETLSEVTGQLLKYRPYLSGMSIAYTQSPFSGGLSKELPADIYPSVRSGIEMAVIDLMLQANPPSPHLPESLPVNALLAADERPVTEQVDHLLMQGHSCIKMKVGAQPLEKDIEDVTAVLSKINGRATLRLDANRRWTLQQARRFFSAVAPRQIEYIEEPTRDPADHLRLLKVAPVSIALDETLAETDSGQLDGKSYRAAVLKPSVLGGFKKTAQIVRWARRHHITPVISSAFQTSLAVRMYLLFAALNKITQVPLGLDTGKWFRKDLLLFPCVINAGTIALPPLAVRPVLRQDHLKIIDT